MFHSINNYTSLWLSHPSSWINVELNFLNSVHLSIDNLQKENNIIHVLKIDDIYFIVFNMAMTYFLDLILKKVSCLTIHQTRILSVLMHWWCGKIKGTFLFWNGNTLLSACLSGKKTEEKKLKRRSFLRIAQEKDIVTQPLGA